MSNQSTPISEQEQIDLCAYGRCWCGRTRTHEIVDDPHHEGGKLSRLVCYGGHDDTDQPGGWDRVWHSIGALVDPPFPPELVKAAALFEQDPNSREAHRLCAPYRKPMTIA